MKYTKPEVTLLASASKAVQGSETKQQQVTRDNMSILATNAAYEADE
jgi:hypothetical protein